MEAIKNATGYGKDHSEEQKKQLYDSLPQEQKEKQSYSEWAKEAYHDQYEKWMPWIEDQYLKWFGKDNKASYAAKGMSNCQIPSPLYTSNFGRHRDSSSHVNGSN